MRGAPQWLCMVVSCLLWLSSAACHAAGDKPSPGPCLSVEPVMYSVGVIGENGQAPVEFVFRNLGETDIRLAYIVTECDCTLELPLQARVPALSEYRLAGRYTAARGVGGEIRETISVYTDCPEQPRIELGLSATITKNTGKDPGP